MCLGVPGRVVEMLPDEIGMPMGRVSFGGVVREVCFAYVPDAVPGEYVLVHVGFALNKVDEEEAQEIFRMLEQMGEPTGPPPPETGPGDAAAP